MLCYKIKDTRTGLLTISFVSIIVIRVHNMPFLPTEKTLDKDIKNLQSNFLAILTSNCHYNTSEITSHIKHINNALDNIKLDYEFQHASKSLAKQFDSDQMKLNETSKR